MMKDTRVLNGLRVLNTRPLGQNQTLSEAILQMGGVSIDLPTLSIEPIDTWLVDLPALVQVQQAIFISANAVKYFFSVLKQQWPSHIMVTAIGKATYNALLEQNITVHHRPESADSEHLLKLSSLQQIDKQTILLVKGEGGLPVINNTLNTRGAHVVPLPVYRRVLPSIPQEFLTALWHENAVDIILLTSQQSISNLFALFGEEARAWLCEKPCLVISQRLQLEAARLGMQKIVVSDYDKILDTLQRMNT